MLEYFNNLSPEEVNRFYKFLQSPYFNSFKTVISLFNYLKSHYPEIKKHHITGKAVSRAVYRRGKYNDGKTRKLISDFNDLMEKFLLQRKLEESDLSSKVLLLNSLRMKYMRRLYTKNLKQIERKQKDEFFKDDEYYYEHIKYNNELMEYLSESKKSIASKIKIQKSRNVNYFFIYSNLVSYFQIISEKIDNDKGSLLFDQSMLNEVLKFTEQNLNVLKKDHPNIYLMYNQLMMFLTFDDKYYDDSLKYFKSRQKKFGTELKKLLFLNMQHYLRIKLNRNKGNYHDNNILIFKLNDLIFNKTDYYKTYFQKGRIMDGYLFIDVLNNAFYLDKIKWLIAFNKNYFRFVNKEQSDDCENIYNAVLKMKNNEFEKAIFYFNQISSKFSPIVLEGKMLCCISLFELNYFDSLKVNIKNMNTYIKNTENKSKLRLQRTSNFLKYFKKLVKIFDSDDLNLIRELIKFRNELDKEDKFIPYRKWFYEKAI